MAMTNGMWDLIMNHSLEANKIRQFSNALALHPPSLHSHD